MIELHHGDCIEMMRTLPDNSVDSIVTDPPYGLGFMGKEWDALPPGEDWARECLRVLKPGGHLLAFGGTRTWHRLAVAIEDAGFEMRDSIAWMHSQGFPKSKATLKPAFEPIIMARKKPKPREGLLNIDACRTPVNAKDADAINRMSVKGYGGQEWDMLQGSQRDKPKVHEGGRWPANVILDEDMAADLDGQSGVSKSVRSARRTSTREAGYNLASQQGDVGYEDDGGASRFFYVAKASPKERPRVDGVTHPTVKPLALMRWLVRLVTPTGGTVLEPFAGSGATVEACILEVVNCIAIEREAEYLPLIQHRIDRQDAA